MRDGCARSMLAARNRVDCMLGSFVSEYGVERCACGFNRYNDLSLLVRVVLLAPATATVAAGPQQ